MALAQQRLAKPHSDVAWLTASATSDQNACWVFMPSFAEACHAVSKMETEQIVWAVTELRRFERELRHELRVVLASKGPQGEALSQRWVDVEVTGDDEAMQPWSAIGEEPERRMAVAAARLAAGALGEVAVALSATVDAWCGRRPAMSRTRVTTTERRAARLYADSHLIAIWTAAHATYVSAVQSGVEEPRAPSIFAVPNAAADTDWSDLFGRRWAPQGCANRTALPLLNTLLRATNPGSRGCVASLHSLLPPTTQTHHDHKQPFYIHFLTSPVGTGHTT